MDNANVDFNIYEILIKLFIIKLINIMRTRYTHTETQFFLIRRNHALTISSKSFNYYWNCLLFHILINKINFSFCNAFEIFFYIYKNVLLNRCRWEFFLFKNKSESGLRQNKTCKQDHSPGNRWLVFCSQ